MNVRVLIADDEPPARTRVRTMLAAHPGFTVIGETGDGAETVDAMLRERPDLIFLDIKMPELDGFEVLEAIRASRKPAPAIVFVTAFDDFAVKAFEVGALDYLLKPFDQARFDRALRGAAERLRSRADRGDADAASLRGDAARDESLHAVLPRRAQLTRVLVRSGRRMHFVRVADIDWLEAQGNYVRLHVDGHARLVRDTMTALEAKLDPHVFVRVHRSAIVNVDRIAHIEPHVHGEFVIVMRDGSRLTTSAAHSAKLRRMLR